MVESLARRAETPLQANLLRLLRDDGPRSRVQLADALGVSRTTVGTEAGRLVDLRLATETANRVRGTGRSPVVDLDPDIRFLGVDIGATALHVGLTDGRLAPVAQSSQPVHLADGPERVLAQALEVARKLLVESGTERLSGAGAGVPGPVSFSGGVTVSPPIMPGWDGYPVRDALARELGCPVVLDNDVNLMALGEQHAGVARSTRDFLFVKIGQGIGCGVVVGGEIYRGADGAAGDIGHIRVAETGPTCACGGTGCLEAFFGGAALVRDATAAARSGESPLLADALVERGVLTSGDVALAVTRGDPAALAMVRDGGRRTGMVVASLVSFFNPGLVVLGGPLSSLGHVLLAEIRSVVYRRSLPLATGNLPVVLSELGESAGVVGGARLVSDQVYASG